MSNFLNWFVIVLTVGNILACLWLIRWSTKRRPGEAAQGEVTGHTWDEDLAEYNNPLPRWWLWLFYITIVFGFVYLALYPGLGNYAGYLGWTQEGQYNSEMKQADTRYGKIFAQYAKTPIPVLAGDTKAMESGHRLFLNYCSQCHGSDAGGAVGFPSLRDKDWLYGGDPDTIQQTILHGRNGNMPPMAAALGGEQGVNEVAAYVWSLSGHEADPALVEAGKAKFAVCAGCHGMDGRGSAANGMPTLGAPNLTDNIWLYHGSLGAIKLAINKGHQGQMPAWKDFLGEDKVHLLAAYVWSLSNQPGAGQ